MGRSRLSSSSGLNKTNSKPTSKEDNLSCRSASASDNKNSGNMERNSRLSRRSVPSVATIAAGKDPTNKLLVNQPAVMPPTGKRSRGRPRKTIVDPVTPFNVNVNISTTNSEEFHTDSIDSNVIQVIEIIDGNEVRTSSIESLDSDVSSMQQQPSTSTSLSLTVAHDDDSTSSKQFCVEVIDGNDSTKSSDPLDISFDSAEECRLYKVKNLKTYQNKRKTIQQPAAIKVERFCSQEQNDEDMKQQDDEINRSAYDDASDCRRSQRTRTIKYDVRDLFNKNKKNSGAKFPWEIKPLSPLTLQNKPEMTPTSEDSSSQASVSDRSTVFSSPQIFKGFSDSDSSKMSPIPTKLLENITETSNQSENLSIINKIVGKSELLPSDSVATSPSTEIRINTPSVKRPKGRPKKINKDNGQVEINSQLDGIGKSTLLGSSNIYIGHIENGRAEKYINVNQKSVNNFPISPFTEQFSQYSGQQENNKIEASENRFPHGEKAFLMQSEIVDLTDDTNDTNDSNIVKPQHENAKIHFENSEILMEIKVVSEIERRESRTFIDTDDIFIDETTRANSSEIKCESEDQSSFDVDVEKDKIEKTPLETIAKLQKMETTPYQNHEVELSSKKISEQGNRELEEKKSQENIDAKILDRSDPLRKQLQNAKKSKWDQEKLEPRPVETSTITVKDCTIDKKETFRNSNRIFPNHEENHLENALPITLSATKDKINEFLVKHRAPETILDCSNESFAGAKSLNFNRAETDRAINQNSLAILSELPFSKMPEMKTKEAEKKLDNSQISIKILPAIDKIKRDSSEALLVSRNNPKVMLSRKASIEIDRLDFLQRKKESSSTTDFSKFFDKYQKDITKKEKPLENCKNFQKSNAAPNVNKDINQGMLPVEKDIQLIEMNDIGPLGSMQQEEQLTENGSKETIVGQSLGNNLTSTVLDNEINLSHAVPLDFLIQHATKIPEVSTEETEMQTDCILHSESGTDNGMLNKIQNEVNELPEPIQESRADCSPTPAAVRTECVIPVTSAPLERRQSPPALESADTLDSFIRMVENTLKHKTESVREILKESVSEAIKEDSNLKSTESAVNNSEDLEVTNNKKTTNFTGAFEMFVKAKIKKGETVVGPFDDTKQTEEQEKSTVFQLESNSAVNKINDKLANSLFYVKDLKKDKKREDREDKKMKNDCKTHNFKKSFKKIVEISSKISSSDVYPEMYNISKELKNVLSDSKSKKLKVIQNDTEECLKSVVKPKPRPSRWDKLSREPPIEKWSEPEILEITNPPNFSNEDTMAGDEGIQTDMLSKLDDDERSYRDLDSPVFLDDEESSSVRRSHRLKSISKSKCQMVGRGLVKDREQFFDGSSLSEEFGHTSLSSLGKFDLSDIPKVDFNDPEHKLSNFQIIKENEYKCECIISKEAKKMVCDCFLTREEAERGELGCGEDCLNRLLMIECGSKCVVGDRCTNRRFQKHVYSGCRVFKTEKKGYGIMAETRIPPGEFIMEYVGEVLNSRQFEKRANEYSKDKNKHYYFMSLRSDAVIDATARGNISRFINHSCDPNAETQKWTVNGELRIGFFSKKRIYPGEEITFDYQFQRYGKEAQKCFCESTNCRGWIGEEPDSDFEDEEEESESDEEQAESPKDESNDDVKGVIPVEFNDSDKDELWVDDRMSGSSKAESRKSGLTSSGKPKRVKKLKPKRRDFLQIKKKKDSFMEEADLEADMDMLGRSGLKNQAQTLRFSRLMVRAKNIRARIQLLEILKNGDIPCRRLFLDYHGLRLLHGWMNDTDGVDPEQELEFRLLIVETLQALPIPNKTMLKECKVFSIIENWAHDKSAEVSPNDSPSDLETVNTTPAAENEKIIETTAKDKLHDIPPNTSLRTDISVLSDTLIKSWENLPEVFRIPKRERIEQMKEHEREADRQYKALNLIDEETDQYQSRKLNNARFGASNKISYKRYKWMREKADKERDIKVKEYTVNKDFEKFTTDPNLSKVQRRELFAAQVAKDEADRRSAEVRRIFECKCKFFGIDYTKIHPIDMPFCVNPATGQWYTADKRKVQTPPSHAHIQVPPKPKSTDPKDYSLPPMDLPPLWKFAIDTRGRLFYYHIKIRIPQWEPPIKILPLSTDDGKPGTSRELLQNDDLHSSSSSESETDGSEADSIEEDAKRDPAIIDAKFSNLEELRKSRRKERHNLLVQERTISPRRDEDRVYNQIEMRRYKENKEKIKRRKEQIKKRRSLLVLGHTPEDTLSTPAAAATESGSQSTKSTPEGSVHPVPIQDYLFSSDEDEDKCDSPLMDTIIQDDKIVDELDALTKLKPLKRPLLLKDRSEYKKRFRQEDKKKEDSIKAVSSKSIERKVEIKVNAKHQARRAKEKFRADIAGIIVQHLTPYRKETCTIGRITNNDDFKHLARKLTHFVMVKELRHCDATGQILIVTESVKNKSREFIKKYMAKFGGTYIRPENDPEFRDIPN